MAIDNRQYLRVMFLCLIFMNRPRNQERNQEPRQDRNQDKATRDDVQDAVNRVMKVGPLRTQ